MHNYFLIDYSSNDLQHYFIYVNICYLFSFSAISIITIAIDGSSFNVIKLD